MITKQSFNFISLFEYSVLFLALSIHHTDAIDSKNINISRNNQIDRSGCKETSMKKDCSIITLCVRFFQYILKIGRSLFQTIRVLNLLHVDNYKNHFHLLSIRSVDIILSYKLRSLMFIIFLIFIFSKRFHYLFSDRIMIFFVSQ